MTTPHLHSQASDDFLWKIATSDYRGHGDSALAELEWREDWANRQTARAHHAYPRRDNDVDVESS